MKRLLLLLAAVTLGMAYAQSQPVIVPGSQTRKITSTNVSGQEYELQIQLPSNYNKSDKKYPVVYLMDSQWDFPLLTALYGEQYYDGFIPELIIVGVTWGGARPNPDSLRARDYTPTNVRPQPQSGGADKFLAFMRNELFPYIENNFKADKNDRTLVGCSLGGLFTMYTLFTQPDLFQRYVAASPAFGWDNDVLSKHEQSYFDKKVTLPARLYMIMGGVERNEPNFEKLVKRLDDRHYTSLQIESRVLENTGHSGTKGEGYARGLQYVFKKPSLQLSAAVLNKYAGNYKTSNGNTLDMKVENNQLVFYAGPNNKFPLFAASETDFYSNAEFLRIHFKTTNNTIDGFQADSYGSSQYITKVK